MTMQKEVKPLGGKEYFQSVCKELGIECNRYFKLGAQNTIKGNAYAFHSDSCGRAETAQFVINYVKALDAYIAWNLNEPKAKSKSNFRVLTSELSPLQGNQILLITKAIEYSSWNQETVFAFNRTAVEGFLKLCMINIKE